MPMVRVSNGGSSIEAAYGWGYVATHSEVRITSIYLDGSVSHTHGSGNLSLDDSLVTLALNNSGYGYVVISFKQDMIVTCGSWTGTTGNTISMVMQRVNAGQIIQGVSQGGVLVVHKLL